jgi:hypothetical protein
MCTGIANFIAAAILVLKRMPMPGLVLAARSALAAGGE